MTPRMRLRRGFTIVELLTVIAIMTILAAIIFPVFATLRRNVTKSSCLANLHSIAQAVKMYKDDYRVYPEALYGYVPLLPDGTAALRPDPNTGQNVLAARTFLFPQYIRDRTTFRCPMNPERTTDITPEKLVDGFNGVTAKVTGVKYFAWDSYDGTRVPHTVANSPYVVHYLRNWDPTVIGQNKGENPRQLIYRYPPDTTVVTWCTLHRYYLPDGSVENGSVDMVLFLDGRAKAVPANLMVADGRAHQVAPGD